MSAIHLELEDFSGVFTLVINGVEHFFALRKLVDGACGVVDGQTQIMDGAL